MKSQVRRLGAGMLVLYVALFIQLNVVQVLRADEYNDHPSNTRAVLRDFNEPRGQILAADGTVLARSVPSDGRFEQRREYPGGELFGQITGYFSFIFGADGVEREYNDALAGRLAPRTVRGLADLFTDDENTADVSLTIPAGVQQVARDALGERQGSVVAIDPRDGALLAMWSFPSYDPTILSNLDLEAARAGRELLLADERKPLLPRSFRENFFPGSTFKVVTGAAGLVSGTISPETAFPVSSAYTPPQTTRPIGNFGGGRCGGNLFDIMRVSCNTAFAQLGVDMGAEALVERARAFGFDRRPPLDLPGAEISPIADPAEFEQNIPLLAQTAIGQNQVRATPLQMALVAAAVANEGVVMRPHVMAEIRDDEGEVVRTWEPERWTQAMPPEVAATLRDAMVGVVERGTARNLALPGIQVAGKTGTAQLGNDLSHAWIIGFAPADAPRVAIAVIVEAQPGDPGQTGGRVAAPVARRVLEAALAVTE